jgi:adenylate cyclase
VASPAQYMVYQFSGFSLDLGRGALLSADGAEVPLRAKSFALLRILVENAGCLVSRAAIMEALWPNTFVTEDNINQCVHDIRRALDAGADRILRTVPRRGYLFTAEVARGQPPPGRAWLPGNAAIRGLSTGEAGSRLPIAAETAVQLPRSENPADPQLPGRPSIAVLAFENLSNDPNQDSFSDGLADDIITGLTRNRSLFVAARTSSFAYKGGSHGMKQIAAELGVSCVVDGSARWDGSRVRVIANLIDAASGSHIWSERIDVERSSGITAFDEIAGRLVRVLSVKLHEDLNRRIEAAPQQDWASDVLVMRGRHYATRPATEANRREALRCFELALDGDPTSVDARIGIARVLTGNIGDGWSRSIVQDTARAERLLLDVLNIGADISEAYFVMGILRRQQGRLDEALFELEKAAELAPNVPATVAQIGQTLIFLGQPEDAIPWVERSLRLAPHDPLTPLCHFMLGMSHLLLSHIEDSINLFRKSLAANFRVYYPYLSLAAALGLRGELDEAAAELRQAIEFRPQIRSLSTLRAQPWHINSRYIALWDKSYAVGLRRAGLPDE